MTLLNPKKAVFNLLFIGLFYISNAFAHDPIFSPGPHVLFKEGVEIHLELKNSNKSNLSDNQQNLAFRYGITGDWVVGLEIPYQSTNASLTSDKAIGDIILSTKYRFWRDDSPGVQKSAAILVKLKLDSASSKASTDTTDSLLGLTYGYESLDWYRWASVRYRFNQDKSDQVIGQINRGDRWFIDIAAGYRFEINDYRAPDTVWLIELNGEFINNNAINGLNIDSSGGEQWFVSPGLMWTLRNFAIKAGLQIPIITNLNGVREKTNYRTFLEFEWHM